MPANTPPDARRPAQEARALPAAPPGLPIAHPPAMARLIEAANSALAERSALLALASSLAEAAAKGHGWFVANWDGKAGSAEAARALGDAVADARAFLAERGL